MHFPSVGFRVLAVFMKKRTKIAGAFLLVYIASYALLSVNGWYAVINHGGADWRKEWCPRYLVYEYLGESGRVKTHLSWLGALYLPCVVADRVLWHPTDWDIGG